MTRKTSVTRAAAQVPNAPRTAAPIALVASRFISAEAFEQAITNFDVDDDLASIIPMPETIPAVIRATITTAIAERFEFSEDLDAWLHAPHDALAGDTPFERIVEGDGIAVLVALAQGINAAGMEAPIKDCQPVPPRLRLVR